MSPLLGCLFEGSDVLKWDVHSTTASGNFASPVAPPPLGSRAGHAQGSPAAAALAAAGVQPHAAATVAALAGDAYISPARLHRMSLKAS